MKTDVRHAGPLVAGVLAVTGLLWLVDGSDDAKAQSGSRRSGRLQQQRQGATGQAERSFEVRFWKWLEQAQYRNWGPMPGQGADFYPGQSPHGAFLKMYVNRKAAGDPANLPPGSVIVKENFSPEKQLMAVTVMYRVRNYDPEHGNWYWVKYNADGTVARTPPDKGNRPIAGKFQSCIDCHSGADGNDFAFANDAPSQ